MFVERSGGETSVQDLLQQVLLRLEPTSNLGLRVQVVVAEALGGTLLSALDDRFDLELAQQTLEFYDVHGVPRPPGDMPETVTSVQFVSDLTPSQPVSLLDYSQGESLFAAATSRRAGRRA